MKAANLVLGVVLIVASMLAGAYSLFTTCSDNALAQAMFRIPSCSSLIAIGVVAFAMLIIGIVVLVIGRERGQPLTQAYPPPAVYYPPPQVQYPHQTPAGVTAQQALQKFCPHCGKWYPADYKLCPKDGNELRAVQ